MYRDPDRFDPDLKPYLNLRSSRCGPIPYLNPRSFRFGS